LHSECERRSPLRKQVANDDVTMRDAEYSGAVNVDHDGEKEKRSFEAN
jgi:hypothetical protein